MKTKEECLAVKMKLDSEGCYVALHPNYFEILQAMQEYAEEYHRFKIGKLRYESHVCYLCGENPCKGHQELV